MRETGIELLATGGLVGCSDLGTTALRWRRFVHGADGLRRTFRRRDGPHAHLRGRGVVSTYGLLFTMTAAGFPTNQSLETLDAQNRIWIMTNGRNNASGVSVCSSHTYTFDALSRRETAAREDTTKWDYDYNDRSEVTAGKKFLSSGAPLAGTASTYNYDAIGNRLTATSGGGPATGFGTPAGVVRSVTSNVEGLNDGGCALQEDVDHSRNCRAGPQNRSLQRSREADDRTIQTWPNF